MSENGIYISDVWYDVPVSPKRYWQIFVNEDKCENAMLVSKSMINFPTHMTMRSKDIVRVAEELQKWKKSLSTK
jgi:dTDP-4-amino-4,6-dideoxygalactose transaminase